MSNNNLNVFINTPFDEEYNIIFRSIVFTVHDCGFIARCALESVDSSRVRIEKLFGLIEESRFGIHDISRTELDEKNDLPRFNMPLELGIFIGAKRFGNREQQEKIALILDTERYRYQKFCSDIAGQDIIEHNNSPEKAITAVRNWLKSFQPETMLPSGVKIIERYNLFLTDLPEFCEVFDLDIDSLEFFDYQNLVVEWLKQNSW